MRNLIVIAMIGLLGSCSLLKGPKPPLTPEEIKANEREFNRQFNLENYEDASQFAKEKKVDRKVVSDTVLGAMWREVYGVGNIQEAWSIANKFQLDNATQKVFARDAFNYVLRAMQCNLAADVAFYFRMDQTYADSAILCAEAVLTINSAIQMACEKPGTLDVQNKIKAGWLKAFQEATPSTRDYWPISQVIEECPFTADEYLDLYNTCLSDDQLYWAFAVASTLGDKKLMTANNVQSLYRSVFQAAIATSSRGQAPSVYVSGYVNLKVAKMILEEKKFVRNTADYDSFIASAIAQFQCGLAATVAIEHNLPSATVEAIFLHQRCLGGTLSEIDPDIVSPMIRQWVFELSLRAREYRFARALVSTFEMGDDAFKQIVDEAIDAKDFVAIMDLDPPKDWDKTLYQWWVLGRLVDIDEEWFVAVYAVANDASNFWVETNWYLWVERAYLHALRRGAFELAADIAAKHNDSDFTDWGVRMAFDRACEADSLADAENVARRYKLGKQAVRRVALLLLKKTQLEEQKKKKQACKKDWNAKPCE